MSDAKERMASALIRARADLDEVLYQLEKLPAADRDAVSFATHALNNFLTVTGGTVQLLLLSLADYPDPQIRTWLEALQQATELMTHTVNQLTTATATASLGPKLRFEKVDLALMVARFCEGYRRFADPKRIQLLQGSTLDVPPVWADRVALAAVLDNLFSNAVKYSSPGKRVWAQVTADRAGVVCSVRDEGPGLSQEDQGRLFQRGARLTPRPTAGEASTGYGLAVAKELVEKLGGTIWCESDVGLGACFSIRLPAHREQPPGASQALA
jgi:two-component system, sensor histidine kinase and response regulator